MSLLLYIDNECEIFCDLDFVRLGSVGAFCCIVLFILYEMQMGCFKIFNKKYLVIIVWCHSWSLVLWTLLSCENIITLSNCTWFYICILLFFSLELLCLAVSFIYFLLHSISFSASSISGESPSLFYLWKQQKNKAGGIWRIRKIFPYLNSCLIVFTPISNFI